MYVRYYQQNFTMSEEQLQTLKENFGKMNIQSLAKLVGENYGKTHNNLRLLGLVGQRKPSGKVVVMKGYFDVDSFGKHYSY